MFKYARNSPQAAFIAYVIVSIPGQNPFSYTDMSDFLKQPLSFRDKIGCMANLYYHFLLNWKYVDHIMKFILTPQPSPEINDKSSPKDAWSDVCLI